MEIETITPTKLSKPIAAMAAQMPDYDWEGQVRYATAAGAFTFNSVQTFDWQGKPNDTRNDNND